MSACRVVFAQGTHTHTHTHTHSHSHTLAHSLTRAGFTFPRTRAEADAMRVLAERDGQYEGGAKRDGEGEGERGRGGA